MKLSISRLIRAGHSAVRPVVLETLLKLLELDIIPVIPLRGSISASGDLSPLSFIAASICGHPCVASPSISLMAQRRPRHRPLGQKQAGRPVRQ